MKTLKYFLTILLFTNIFSTHAQEEDGGCGIMKLDGTILTPAIFDDIDYDALIFGEEHVVAKKDSKSWVIGSEGKVLNKSGYDYISVFARPLYEVRNNGKHGFVNKKGEEVIPCIYDDYITTDRRRQWYMMQKDDEDRYGMVDSLNNIMIPFEYTNISYYQDEPTYNIALQKENNKWALADTTGKAITPFIYNRIKLLNNGGALAWIDCTIYFMSSKGIAIDSVADCNDRKINDLNYFVAVQSYADGTDKKATVSLYNYDGSIIKKYDGYYINSFSSDKLVSINTNYGYLIIDTLGQEVTQLKFNPTYRTSSNGIRFYNGKALLSDGSKKAVIDIKGNILIPFVYDYLDMILGDFDRSNSYIVRQKGMPYKQFLYLDNGKPILMPEKYDDLFCYEDGTEKKELFLLTEKCLYHQSTMM